MKSYFELELFPSKNEAMLCISEDSDKLLSTGDVYHAVEATGLGYAPDTVLVKTKDAGVKRFPLSLFTPFRVSKESSILEKRIFHCRHRINELKNEDEAGSWELGFWEGKLEAYELILNESKL